MYFLYRNRCLFQIKNIPTFHICYNMPHFKKVACPLIFIFIFQIWTCGTHLCCLKPFSLVSVKYLWLKFLGPHSAMSSSNNLLHRQRKAAIETIFLYFPNTGNSWFNIKMNTAKRCCQQCLSLGIIQGRKENKWQKRLQPWLQLCAYTQPALTVTSHYDTVVRNF